MIWDLGLTPSAHAQPSTEPIAVFRWRGGMLMTTRGRRIWRQSSTVAQSRSI